MILTSRLARMLVVVAAGRFALAQQPTPHVPPAQVTANGQHASAAQDTAQGFGRTFVASASHTASTPAVTSPGAHHGIAGVNRVAASGNGADGAARAIIYPGTGSPPAVPPTNAAVTGVDGAATIVNGASHCGSTGVNNFATASHAGTEATGGK